MRHWELILEADDPLREAERAYHEGPGDVSNLHRYTRELQRAGRHGEVDNVHRAHLKNHLDAYHTANTKLQKLVGPNWSLGHLSIYERGIAGDALQSKNEHVVRLRNRAHKIGRKSGELVHRREDQSPADHAHDLADLHAKSSIEHVRHYERPHSEDRPADVGARVFHSKEAAQRFHRTLKYHYPDSVVNLSDTRSRFDRAHLEHHWVRYWVPGMTEGGKESIEREKAR